METVIETINDIKSAKSVLERAGELIKSGALVAFPTETVYGLGANGLDASACAKIYEAKGRPSDNPLILHIAERKMLDDIAEEISPLAEKLMTAFWPGPLTLIFKKKSVVPDSVTGGLDTVAVRMPDNDVATALIKAAGVPVAAPSANRSGRPSPTMGEAVFADMQGKIPLILDGGACSFGVESTIVETVGECALILRPGAITAELIAELASEVKLDDALKNSDKAPKAPGMKYTHYAPLAPLTLAESAELLLNELTLRTENGERVGAIVSEETAKLLQGKTDEALVKIYGARGDLKTIAANLYECLRFFDDKGATSLLAEATTHDGLGLAIMNRLHKASGGRFIGG